MTIFLAYLIIGCTLLAALTDLRRRRCQAVLSPIQWSAEDYVAAVIVVAIWPVVVTWALWMTYAPKGGSR